MSNVAYLSMDVHVRRSILGEMNAAGIFKGNRAFITSEQNIIEALKTCKAKIKYLAIEEGTLASWVAQVARPYVREVIIADPRENALIYRGAKKKDEVDTRNLCRLLRLGELNHVYHPEEDDRALFKAAVQQYIDLRKQQVALKQKIKAMYRHWGIVRVEGEVVYGIRGRDSYLQQLKQLTVQNQLKRLYSVLDETEAMQEAALREAKQLGRKYPEIQDFKKIPGIGDIGALIFDGYIQTPHRFRSKRPVWRYCRLGINERSSDGKLLGYKRLDKSGIPEIKAMSYWAWMSAMKSDNEVKQFYLRSLCRTHSRVHARLNTQRKIIAVMYGMWKRGESYRPELFLGPSN